MYLLACLQQHPRANALAAVRVEGQHVLRRVVVDLVVDLEVDNLAVQLEASVAVGLHQPTAPGVWPGFLLRPPGQTIWLVLLMLRSLNGGSRLYSTKLNQVTHSNGHPAACEIKGTGLAVPNATYRAPWVVAKRI